MSKWYLLLIGLLVWWYFSALVAKAVYPIDKIASRVVYLNLGQFDELEAVLGQRSDVFGVASHYNYVLDSGWSSVGHYIAATRDFDRYQYLKITNVENNKSVVVYTTDYGPMTCADRIKAGIDNKDCIERIIDLSSTAFSELAPLEVGLINVKIEKLAR